MAGQEECTAQQQEQSSKTKQQASAHKDISGHIDFPAPDGGYGWVIVFSCFLTHVVVGGLDRSDGVFFLQFVDRFQEGAQLTSWPLALASAIRMVVSPLTSAFSSRYSARTACMIGSTIMFASFIVTGLIDNVYLLFLTFALLQGLGRGFMCAPGMIILAMYFDKYFDKRRGLAIGIAASGVGMGSLLFVPTVQYLFDAYGFTGAFLVLSVLCSNLFLVAMLYRPLSRHHRFTSRMHVFALSTNETELLTGKTDLEQVSGEKHSPSQKNESQIVLEIQERCKDGRLRSKSIEFAGPDAGNGFIKGRDLPDLLPHGNGSSKFISDERKATAISSNTNMQHCSRQKHHGFFKSAATVLFPIEKANRSGKREKKLFQPSLLRYPPFLLYCLSLAIFSIAYKAGFTFLPALAEERGLPETQAALVVSISGVVDTVGRFVAGYVLDRGATMTRRALIYNLFQLPVMASDFVFPSLASLGTFIAMSCGYAAFTGACMASKTVIAIDILGVENTANAIGLIFCSQGLGTLVGPPVSGALIDYFGHSTRPSTSVVTALL